MHEMRNVGARQWLSNASAGHCGATVDLGDCDIGDQGTFGEPQAIAGATDRWRAATRWCLVQCASCSRCQYISLSLKYQDCSWYATCDLQRLHMPPSGRKRDFFSGAMPARLTRRKPAQLPRAESHAAREALRLAATSPRPWDWFKPRAGMRVALVMFGKVGTLESPSSWIGADSGSASVVRVASLSMKRRLLAANPSAAFDVFAHSWNPGLGSTIDTLYRPVWSQHQVEVRGLRPAHSGLRSIRRALQAKQAHEQRTRTLYDLVCVMRHDIVFLRPVRLDALPAGQIWFPEHCCHWTPSPTRPGVPPSLTRAYEAMKSTCVGTNGAVPDLCRASYMIGLGRGDTSRLTIDAERSYFLNDWLLLAPSATADTFAEIDPRFDGYTAALKEV